MTTRVYRERDCRAIGKDPSFGPAISRHGSRHGARVQLGGARGPVFVPDELLQLPYVVPYVHEKDQRVSPRNR